MANMLLDFEKVYDRVDILRLGFQVEWITSVSDPYRSTSSTMIIAGRMGDPFQLKRYVKQSFPFVPYLFLLYE
eukprot:c42703_g1_i1 orf=173-391(+)